MARQQADRPNCTNRNALHYHPLVDRIPLRSRHRPIKPMSGNPRRPHESSRSAYLRLALAVRRQMHCILLAIDKAGASFERRIRRKPI